MIFPTLRSIQKSREMTTYFNGYSHLLSCQEGAFFDAKNISTEFYPILSPRHKRGKVRQITNPLGLTEKDGLVWVDGDDLYINGVKKTLASGVTIDDETEKSITKMGAYIVIMPDKIWYNTKDDTSGYMEASANLTTTVTFTLCATDGSAITWHDDAYYETHAPQNGDYKMSTFNGRTTLSIYSSATGLWTSVPSTFMKITAIGIGSAFEEGDGVKITVNLSGISWTYAENIFVNDEGDGKRSSTFTIQKKGTDYITVPALLDVNKNFNNFSIEVKRSVPDMAFVTECQNRLWGCSTDGHEIYACKLGDVKNWNVFQGISTDSWAATIGTDGLFTGAYTYLGYPIFFKENSLIRVTVSSVGGHQTRDLNCRGVQSGSEKSLVMLNELLYYKSADGICIYDGNFPTNISDALGEVRYHNASGGSINDRYYVSMQDESDAWHLFVFDKKHNLWSKEDATQVKWFARKDDELYFIGGDNYLYSVYGTEGTEEEKLPWFIESGNIGFALPDNKYVSRFNVRMFLANESHASMFIQYDDESNWQFLFDMNGKGLKSFTVPVRPRRCDHFRFKIVGLGDAKIYSITKSIEEGSDT